MNIKPTASFSAEVAKAIQEKRPVQLAAKWNVKHYRDGKLLSEQENTNLFTTEGLNHMVDVIVGAGTQITQYYVALSDTNTSPAAGMTYAVPVFTESSATVSTALRQAFTVVGAASGSTNNTASPAQYTSAGSNTFYGACLIGGGSAPTTKADTAGGGKLLSYDLFGTAVTTVLNDIVTITVTFTLADT